MCAVGGGSGSREGAVIPRLVCVARGEAALKDALRKCETGEEGCVTGCEWCVRCRGGGCGGCRGCGKGVENEGYRTNEVELDDSAPAGTFLAPRLGSVVDLKV